MNTTPLDHTPTILIIDDDPSATKLIGKLLLLKGYKVLTANTGAEGLELLKQNPVDLVILDLLMPKMHGWEVSAEIKGFSSVPILIISAIDSPKMISKTLDKGADDYLPKPVTANILLARLETLIRRYAYEKYATSPLPES